MGNTCPLCQTECPNYFSYTMHKSVCKPVTGPYEPKRGTGKHPLSKEEKAVIVKRVETRLGSHNFYGGN